MRIKRGINLWFLKKVWEERYATCCPHLQGRIGINNPSLSIGKGMNRMGNAIEHNTPPKLVSYLPNGRSNPSALEISLDPRRTDTIIFLLFGNATCQSGRQSWIKASRPQRKRDRGWQECSSVAVERDTAKRHFVRSSRVEAKAS